MVISSKKHTFVRVVFYLGYWIQLSNPVIIKGDQMKVE